MSLFLIILLNFIISLMSLVGVSTIAVKSIFKKRLTCIFISFSAGVLLASAFLNMLAEALHDSNEEILIYALGGMVFGFLMERSVLWYHHHHENTHNIKPTASLVLFGDSIHNFIDGIAIAATTVVSPIAGISTAIGIVAHEIPQEFADFMILVNAGFGKKKALIYNFFSALFAVVGGIVGFYFLQLFSGLLPISLATTAGIFIYIAAADLIPELHEDYKKNKSLEQVVPFMIGMTLIYLMAQFFTHAH